VRTVTTPDGATWRIKRHWISRKPRWRRQQIDPDRGTDIAHWAPDLLSLFDDTSIGPFVAVIVVIGLLLFFTGFFIFIVEIVIVAVAIVLTVVAKILFRRPWYVEAIRAGDGLRRRWAVVGWRRSGEFVEEVARSFEAGVPFRASGDARELGTSIEAITPQE
jgi:hypothetical protein